MNFCDYAMNVNGVLKDQVGTYIAPKAVTRRKLKDAGEEVIQALTLRSNISITLPINE